jgi:hypothetical protein
MIKNVDFNVINKFYRDMDYALVANGELLLFEYHYINQVGNAEFEQLVNKVSLIVDYETIYKETKTLIGDSINIL